MGGRLALCPTPIGNLGDITLRVLEELRAATLILAEDTRRTGLLLRHHGIPGARLLSYHDHNEERRLPEVLERLAAGEQIALVSDAGTPLLADPGFRLVRAAVRAGIDVTALPGPSALLPALTLSALPAHRFAFLGFRPRAAAARRAEVAAALALPLTVAWYESLERLPATLAAIVGLGCGARPAAVARELTKLHEEVLRGSVQDLAGHCAAHALRGEAVLLVGPPPQQRAAEPSLDEALREVTERRGRGESLPQAVATTARARGLGRRELYAAAAGTVDASGPAAPGRQPPAPSR